MKPKKKKKKASAATSKGTERKRAHATSRSYSGVRALLTSHPDSRAYVAMMSIALLVFMVFGYNITFDYIEADASKMVFANPHIASGLTADNIYWAFAQPNLSLYQPLPSLTFMQDSDIFGQWPGGYHLVTTMWHAAGMCLFFWVMYRLTGHFAAVFAATLLMSIHPTQILTVSQIVTRNEIMQGVFLLLSIEAYRRYATADSWRAYGFSLFFMLLGLLCKQMILVLPAVLLLLDYWPLGRLTLSLRTPRETVRAALRLFVEKTPYFVLSAAGVFMAYYGKSQFDGLSDNVGRLTLSETAYFAITGYARYLGHLIYPVRIGYFTLDTVQMSLSPFVASAGLLVLITAIAMALLWKKPYVAVGWFWFVLLMLPMSGVVHYMNETVSYMAETISLRYLYSPVMGIYLTLCFGLHDMLSRGRERTPGQPMATPLPYWAITGALTTTLVVLTLWQHGFYRDTEAMAQRVFDLTNGRSAFAHSMLANIRREQGLIEQSNMHFRKSVELAPDQIPLHLFYADELFRQERFEDALEVARNALEKEPEHADLLGLCGMMLMKLKRYEDAESYLRRAVAAEPESMPDRHNLAYCLVLQRKFEEARAHIEHVLTVTPDNPRARALLERLELVENAGAAPRWKEIP